MSDLFLRACRGEVVERVPLWVMRQAGRYLPEYRAVRAKHDFLTVCRTPELATEVTLQPIDRFALDASILFSDIMIPLESMGVSLAFNPGPVVAEPIRDAAAVERLRVLDDGEAIAPFVMDTVRMLRRELASRGVPLIGFAGAPLTLAAYLVEGKGSKDFAQLRALLYRAPEVAQQLLDKLATVVGHYLRAQVDAGAQALQLFDSWAGVLSEREYTQFALPAVKKVWSVLGETGQTVPRIYFAQNAGAFLPRLAEAKADVLGIDWRQDFGRVRQVLGNEVVLQGNLDPAVLFATPEVVEREAKRVLRSGGGHRHVFNLGHGIQPHTPVENMEHLCNVVRNYRFDSANAA